MGMLDKLVERIQTLGNEGQTNAQANAANLKVLAEKYGKDGASCNIISRPEAKAIANNADKPEMAGAARNCSEAISAFGYTPKAPGG